MNVSDKDFLSRIVQDRHTEFNRSVIEGVEVKLCRNDPHAYKPHVHNELSLGYIIEGSTDLTLSDMTIHYEAGDGVVIPPLMTHRCAPKDITSWAYVILFIDPDYYGNSVTFCRAKKFTGSQVRRLCSFIEQLVAERLPDTLENILIELLLEFGEKSITETAADHSNDIVTTIHDYIINHVTDDITLDKLQEISGLNKFTLIRSFKKQYITTPAAYHLQYRVAEAKRFLSNGVDVFDICEKLHFFDQAHLIREFKKMYGITPAAYIGQIKG